MRLSEGLTPPGSWKYQEGNFWIYGDSAKDLIAKIEAHRKANGKEVGDPWKDVETQIVERHPELGIV